MDLENIEKNGKSTSKLTQKMLQAQNIKLNLSKISKLSSKYTPTQSPCQQSLIENTSPRHLFSQNLSKLNILSPRHTANSNVNSNANSPNTSMIQNNSSRHLSNPCLKCQKYKSLFKQERNQKQKLQNKYQQLSQLKQQLDKKLCALEKKVQKSSEAVQPYMNNVIFMQGQLQAIKRSLVVPQKPKQLQSKIYQQFTQKKRTIDFQLNFLLKSHERAQQTNNEKLHRLNFLIQYLQNKTKQLQIQNMELSHQNRILNSIIHQSTYVVQQRQLFHMASQQLYQTKILYKNEKKQKQILNKLVQKLKNKIYMLTSLIGYGVVSNIQNNDLHQITKVKQNIQSLNKNMQERLTIDAYGLQALKGFKNSYYQVKQHAAKDQNISNCLYQPNFLIMFDDNQVKNALQQNVTTMIKPQFFLLVRAIFDSKYLQFLIQGTKTNRFVDFTYTFIDFFQVRKNQKRIQINMKRDGDQKDFMKTNFLLRIFDRKVGYLPEIVTFREFLIKNTPQDQIFYYLMCRNYIYNGLELDNYIICSEAYNFVCYERVLQRVQDLVQNLDKNSKSILFSHLNDKKVMKNKKLLIKANYVIRILLQIYQKQKSERIFRLRIIFDQTCRLIKSDTIKFVHFKQLLRKNFPKLTNNDISQYYRRSLSIFQTQTTTFFQAFNVSSLQYIFLIQNLSFNEQLRSRMNQQEQRTYRPNYLMQLIPDSVSHIGNQNLYQQYISLMRVKNVNLQNRVKIMKFLTKIVQVTQPNLRYNQNNISQVIIAQKENNKLIQMLDESNNKLIDFINKNFKQRVKYEEALDKASSTIGKQFKKKIYEFYSQFVKDIKQQIGNQPNRNFSV